MPHVQFTLALPSPTSSFNHEYPEARKAKQAFTASEALPPCLSSYRTTGRVPAIYRFEIRQGGSISHFYIGETGCFAARMGHYCGMTRRLLALHQTQRKVVLEKHPLRHIHYYIARALLAGSVHAIDLHWCWLGSSLTKRQRQAIETAEQVRFAKAHGAKLIAGIAGSGNFETHPPPDLTSAWVTVIHRLMTCPNRNGKRPPFVV